jgi:hypothetical protein
MVLSMCGQMMPAHLHLLVQDARGDPSFYRISINAITNVGLDETSPTYRTVDSNAHGTLSTLQASLRKNRCSSDAVVFALSQICGGDSKLAVLIYNSHSIILELTK